MIKTLLQTATVALFATTIAASAQAITIVPVSATGSSSYPGYPDADAIDQGAGADLTDWASFSEGASSTLRLDLGAVHKLSTAFVTDRVTSGGGNGAFSGGLLDFTTSYSLTAYTDATFTTAIGGPIIVTKTAPVSPTTPVEFLSMASLGGITAEFIQYSVLATDGVNPGLSDIRFDGSVVPEPATWALMLVGFGLVGASVRRRIVRVVA